MATLCKNCGHALIFDPSIQKVRCEQCGSTFLAEEVESESKKYVQDQKALSMQQVYGQSAEGAAKEYLDCYIYTCSECGGEVMINGTEVSTKCVYCGNPTVVFSRISKQECPEFIIPFAITKEQALAAIKTEIGHGLFVPKAVQTFTPESVHGIYIPYWIVDADRYETTIIRKKTSSGKHTHITYHGRSGTMRLKNLPLDACTMLSDESSTRLEPYDFSKMVMFDEDYLLGFYSNTSDLTYGDLSRAVEERSKKMFDEEVLKSVKGGTTTIVKEVGSCAIDPDVKYALLPAWFVTFEHEGQHNTILVNGQTGKVVCGLPIRKALFYTLLIITCIVLVTVMVFIGYHFFDAILSSSSRRARRSSSSSNNNSGKIIMGMITGGVLMIIAGVKKIKNVFAKLRLTQSAKTFNFTKKRQE